MIAKSVFYLCLLGAGYMSYPYFNDGDKVADLLPYSVHKNESSYVLTGPNFSKTIFPNGELGSVYERMQGLLLEDMIELDYALKRVQRSRLAESTPSRD